MDPPPRQQLQRKALHLLHSQLDLLMIHILRPRILKLLRQTSRNAMVVTLQYLMCPHDGEGMTGGNLKPLRMNREADLPACHLPQIHQHTPVYVLGTTLGYRIKRPGKGTHVSTEKEDRMQSLRRSSNQNKSDGHLLPHQFHPIPKFKKRSGLCKTRG